MTAARRDNLDPLRAAIDADLSRLCTALGMHPDGKRFYCPHCQNDGGHHADGDFSVEAGLKCHRCGWSGDGLALVRAVRHCEFPAAVEFARELYGVRDAQPAPAPRAARKGGKVHPDLDAAARVALWLVEKQTECKHTLTRTDVYADPDGPDLIEWRFDRVGELDEHGKPEKTFITGHTVPDGFKLGDPPGALPLLNKAAVIESQGPIYVCEGPKACEAGAGIGLLCTTSAHGARSPDMTDWTPLRGRDVVILPDNDPAGMAYAEKVAGILEGLQ